MLDLYFDRELLLTCTTYKYMHEFVKDHHSTNDSLWVYSDETGEYTKYDPTKED